MEKQKMTKAYYCLIISGLVLVLIGIVLSVIAIIDLFSAFKGGFSGKFPEMFLLIFIGFPFIGFGSFFMGLARYVRIRKFAWAIYSQIAENNASKLVRNPNSAETIYCSKCGNPNAIINEVEYCSKCGSKIIK